MTNEKLNIMHWSEMVTLFVFATVLGNGKSVSSSTVHDSSTIASSLAATSGNEMLTSEQPTITIISTAFGKSTDSVQSSVDVTLMQSVETSSEFISSVSTVSPLHETSEIILVVSTQQILSTINPPSNDSSIISATSIDPTPASNETDKTPYQLDDTTPTSATTEAVSTMDRTSASSSRVTETTILSIAETTDDVETISLHPPTTILSLEKTSQLSTLGDSMTASTISNNLTSILSEETTFISLTTSTVDTYATITETSELLTDVSTSSVVETSTVEEAATMLSPTTHDTSQLTELNELTSASSIPLTLSSGLTSARSVEMEESSVSEISKIETAVSTQTSLFTSIQQSMEISIFSTFPTTPSSQTIVSDTNTPIISGTGQTEPVTSVSLEHTTESTFLVTSSLIETPIVEETAVQFSMLTTDYGISMTVPSSSADISHISPTKARGETELSSTASYSLEIETIVSTKLSNTQTNELSTFSTVSGNPTTSTSETDKESVQIDSTTSFTQPTSSSETPLVTGSSAVSEALFTQRATSLRFQQTAVAGSSVVETSEATTLQLPTTQGTQTIHLTTHSDSDLSSTNSSDLIPTLSVDTTFSLPIVSTNESSVSEILGIETVSTQQDSFTSNTQTVNVSVFSTVSDVSTSVTNNMNITFIFSDATTPASHVTSSPITESVTETSTIAGAVTTQSTTSLGSNETEIITDVITTFVVSLPNEKTTDVQHSTTQVSQTSSALTDLATTSEDLLSTASSDVISTQSQSLRTTFSMLTDSTADREGSSASEISESETVVSTQPTLFSSIHQTIGVSIYSTRSEVSTSATNKIDTSIQSNINTTPTSQMSSSSITESMDKTSAILVAVTTQDTRSLGSQQTEISTRVTTTLMDISPTEETREVQLPTTQDAQTITRLTDLATASSLGLLSTASSNLISNQSIETTLSLPTISTADLEKSSISEILDSETVVSTQPTLFSSVHQTIDVSAFSTTFEVSTSATKEIDNASFQSDTSTPTSRISSLPITESVADTSAFAGEVTTQTTQITKSSGSQSTEMSTRLTTTHMDISPTAETTEVQLPTTQDTRTLSTLTGLATASSLDQLSTAPLYFVSTQSIETTVSSLTTSTAGIEESTVSGFSENELVVSTQPTLPTSLPINVSAFSTTSEIATSATKGIDNTSIQFDTTTQTNEISSSSMTESMAETSAILIAVTAQDTTSSGSQQTEMSTRVMTTFVNLSPTEKTSDVQHPTTRVAQTSPTLTDLATATSMDLLSTVSSEIISTQSLRTTSSLLTDSTADFEESSLSEISESETVVSTQPILFSSVHQTIDVSAFSTTFEVSTLATKEIDNASFQSDTSTPTSQMSSLPITESMADTSAIAGTVTQTAQIATSLGSQSTEMSTRLTTTHMDISPIGETTEVQIPTTQDTQTLTTLTDLATAPSLDLLSTASPYLVSTQSIENTFSLPTISTAGIEESSVSGFSETELVVSTQPTLLTSNNQSIDVSAFSTTSEVATSASKGIDNTSIQFDTTTPTSEMSSSSMTESMAETSAILVAVTSSSGSQQTVMSTRVTTTFVDLSLTDEKTTDVQNSTTPVAQTSPTLTDLATATSMDLLSTVSSEIISTQSLRTTSSLLTDSTADFEESSQSEISESETVVSTQPILFSSVHQTIDVSVFTNTFEVSTSATKEIDNASFQSNTTTLTSQMSSLPITESVADTSAMVGAVTTETTQIATSSRSQSTEMSTRVTTAFMNISPSEETTEVQLPTTQDTRSLSTLADLATSSSLLTSNRTIDVSTFSTTSEVSISATDGINNTSVQSDTTTPTAQISSSSITESVAETSAISVAVTIQDTTSLGSQQTDAIPEVTTTIVDISPTEKTTNLSLTTQAAQTLITFNDSATASSVGLISTASSDLISTLSVETTFSLSSNEITGTKESSLSEISEIETVVSTIPTLFTSNTQTVSLPIFYTTSEVAISGTSELPAADSSTEAVTELTSTHIVSQTSTSFTAQSSAVFTSNAEIEQSTQHASPQTSSEFTEQTTATSVTSSSSTQVAETFPGTKTVTTEQFTYLTTTQTQHTVETSTTSSDTSSVPGLISSVTSEESILPSEITSEPTTNSWSSGVPLLTSGGLTDGEIAAIVVCSVVGGAAVVGGSSYLVFQWRRARYGIYELNP